MKKKSCFKNVCSTAGYQSGRALSGSQIQIQARTSKFCFGKRNWFSYSRSLGFYQMIICEKIQALDRNKRLHSSTLNLHWVVAFRGANFLDPRVGEGINPSVFLLPLSDGNQGTPHAPPPRGKIRSPSSNPKHSWRLVVGKLRFLTSGHWKVH